MAKSEGMRVGAICGTDKEKMIVEVFGFGVYEGDHVAGEDDPMPVGWVADMMRDYARPNPKIRLDSGKIVWGCECWWGSEEEIRRKLAACEESGYSVVEIDIEEKRAEILEQASQTE